LACVVALTALGCSADRPVAAGRLGDGTASSAPQRHTGQELAQALPTGRRELHGFRVQEQCRTLTRSCYGEVPPVFLSVLATRGDDTLLLVVRRKGTRHYWRKVAPQLCPTGRVDQPIESHGPDRFRPGEHGRASRTPYRIGSWWGLHCVRHIRYDYPATYDPAPDDLAPTERHLVLLRNGHHYLQVQAHTRRLAITFAREYLDRLAP